MAKKSKLFVVIGCHGDDKVLPCPFRGQKATEGAGCADDYFCTGAKNKDGTYGAIDGYVEWQSEMRKPGDFPKFCPLPNNVRGYKARGVVI